MSDIRTPCCGAEVFISMAYEMPDEIECDGPTCFNSWTPTGEVIRYVTPEGDSK